jgi:Carboxypeptidase regulatory-like domain
MKRKINSIIAIISLSFAIAAQTGGTFDLSHSVIASGGGSNSTGGTFRVDGTVGQPAAGTISTSGNFSLRGGFWAFDSIAPTAALVSISGRVLTADGQGIRNVRVTLTMAGGTVRSAQTGTFGYFRFDEVEVGQTLVLEVSSKRYRFTNPTRILSVQEEITDAVFIAELP